MARSIPSGILRYQSNQELVTKPKKVRASSRTSVKKTAGEWLGFENPTRIGECKNAPFRDRVNGKTKRNKRTAQYNYRTNGWLDESSLIPQRK